MNVLLQNLSVSTPHSVLLVPSSHSKILSLFFFCLTNETSSRICDLYHSIYFISEARFRKIHVLPTTLLIMRKKTYTPYHLRVYDPLWERIRALKNKTEAKRRKSVLHHQTLSAKRSWSSRHGSAVNEPD